LACGWIEPKDLKGEPFVALNPEDAPRRPIDAAMRQAGVTLNVVVETPYATGVCALVQAGPGVGLVNPLSVQEGYRRSLKLVAFRPKIRFRHLLLLPPHQPQGRALQALIAMARAVIAER
jgi:DNA-binding transcriptional LysR family regulator